MELAERLRERRGELEEAIGSRAYAVADPVELGDPRYTAGLREAIDAALDYALRTLFEDGTPDSPIPSVLLIQARQAARSGVSLDTVLRRYFAGYTLLGDFILQEAKEQISVDLLQRLSRTQAVLFERLITVVSDEYAREAERKPRSPSQHRVEKVRRLLDGNLVDVVELGYEPTDRWHLGLAASGPGASAAIRELARALDCNLLLVHPGEGMAWAWLGARHKREAENAAKAVAPVVGEEIAVAIGESAYGLAGWRLTHRQALAALPIALHGNGQVVCYGEVSLLASALRDDLLTCSLQATYIAPLEGEPDDGAAFLATLRSYCEAGGQVAATAASLGVSRQTVHSRLRAIEERIGQPVERCTTQIETALRLREVAKRQAF